MALPWWQYNKHCRGYYYYYYYYYKLRIPRQILILKVWGRLTCGLWIRLKDVYMCSQWSCGWRGWKASDVVMCKLWVARMKGLWRRDVQAVGGQDERPLTSWCASCGWRGWKASDVVMCSEFTHSVSPWQQYNVVHVSDSVIWHLLITVNACSVLASFFFFSYACHEP